MHGAIPNNEEIPVWDSEAASAAGDYIEDDLLVRGTVLEESDAGLWLKCRGRRQSRRKKQAE